jgi:hypothetical protein
MLQLLEELNPEINDESPLQTLREIKTMVMQQPSMPPCDLGNIRSILRSLVNPKKWHGVDELILREAVSALDCFLGLDNLPLEISSFAEILSLLVYELAHTETADDYIDILEALLRVLARILAVGGSNTALVLFRWSAPVQQEDRKHGHASFKIMNIMLHIMYSYPTKLSFQGFACMGKLLDHFFESYSTLLN